MRFCKDEGIFPMKELYDKSLNKESEERARERARERQGEKQIEHSQGLVKSTAEKIAE